MAKKKIRKLNKKYYVTDEYGHDDSLVVGKINELIDIINVQQEEIKTLKLLALGRK